MFATKLSNSIGLASNASHPVAMACSRSLASAGAVGMSRVCGSLLRRRTGSQRINVWHFQVHQNYVRVLGRSQLAAPLAVVGCENLKITDQLEPRLEYVDVVVVVFDLLAVC